MSAARCRYGSARPMASAQPASTALRNARSGPTRTRARDQELGHVDVERRLGRTERRRREVDEHRAVVGDEHVAQVEPAVGDARRMKPGDLLHRGPPSVSSRHADRGSRSSSGSTSGWRVTTSASSFRAERGASRPRAPGRRPARPSSVTTPSCSTCSSRADRRASRRIAVGQEAPAASQALRVLRVATEHADLQLASPGVVADVVARTRRAAASHGEKVAHLDAERGHRRAHVLGRRHAGSRAERKPHDRAGPEAERQRAEGRGRKRSAEHHGATRCERDEPGGEHPRPADELRAGDDERPRSPLASRSSG